jgi:hypothetical protein
MGFCDTLASGRREKLLLREGSAEREDGGE